MTIEKRFNDKEVYAKITRFIDAQGRIDRRASDFIGQQPYFLRDAMWKYYHAHRKNKYNLVRVRDE